MSGTASLQAAERRIHIVQGEQHVSNEAGTVLSTILGSCVAACVRDPVAGVGGMNHFLLPGDNADADRSSGGNALRFGVHAMELLLNGLLQRGASRGRLEAKLFGGARMMKGLTDIGEHNAAFAERFLRVEGIAIVGGSLRGDRGRRIQYWPISGRARQIILNAGDPSAMNIPRAKPAAEPASDGSLELF